MDNRSDNDENLKTLQHSLKERIKELTCLYDIAEIVEKYGDDIESILQAVAELIPGSWQYPEITCVQIEYEQKRFTTPLFENSPWKQESTIKVDGKIVGHVSVCYLEKKDELDEGPFLKEERLLINAISERLGRIAERIKAKKQLEMEKKTLERKNIALKEVLSQIQEEKKEVSGTFQNNVDKIIMPIVFTLEKTIDKSHIGYIDLLKKSLLNMTSPLINNLSQSLTRLTPTEIQICNMIKNGFTSKEIAELRHLSPSTVHRHRENIRKKLKITGTNINLTSYLTERMDV